MIDNSKIKFPEELNLAALQQETELAPLASTGPSVYPTKRHRPRTALSPVWSGPSIKICIGNTKTFKIDG
ncbi:unnamed protein product [Orchesella dallaii]|uniref:Uncharacterized protein n=1 Tax=Orchesella dallaii TaxID=48710 RepID=A0ABP1S549_9HEXA